MVERRVAGEPLQYVLGAWSFRGLDLMVDPRVLIPAARDRNGRGDRARRSRADRLAPGPASARARRRQAVGRGGRPRHGFGRDRARARGRAPRRRGVGDRRERRRARGRPAPTSRAVPRRACASRPPDRGSTRCPRRCGARCGSSCRTRPTSPSRGRRAARGGRGVRTAARARRGAGRHRGDRRAARAARGRGSRPAAPSCWSSRRTRPAMVTEDADAVGYAEAFVRDDLSGRPRVLVAAHRVAFRDMAERARCRRDARPVPRPGRRGARSAAAAGGGGGPSAVHRAGAARLPGLRDRRRRPVDVRRRRAHA